MEMQLVDLPWLPEPPASFRQHVRTLAIAGADAIGLARKLTQYRLNNSQLHTLGNTIGTLTASSPDACRLGILSNATTELLPAAISVSTLRHGVPVQVVSAAFGQVAAEALNSRSAMNRANCHFVLLAVDHRGLPLTPTPGDEDRARETVRSALQYIDSMRHALHATSGCTVIAQTVPQPATALFGNLERTLPGTQHWLVDQYNAKLRNQIWNSSDLLLDTAALAETVGLSQWHDPRQWNLGKFAFAHAVVPLLADSIGRLIAAARGRSRKCLVLDLDNTLWGGVVADDGLAGIVLGNGSPNGEAYLQIQKTAIALRERGIVLAVSSKNDDRIARDCFRKHPEMLLKEEHIAVFQANWQDKASNLRAIARTLNIGVDTLVLLDDNPAERAQVRQVLPDIAVPELPADPAYFSQTLLAAGYFESTAFTEEDRSRAEQYRANAARIATLGATTDVQSFLKTLQMRAIFLPFDSVSRPRITQLINKTNQFNLTTRRYADADVAAFEASKSGLTLQTRLIDRFGDNGIIAAVICVENNGNWVIDTWLMSCRVLNRDVEQATLNYLVSRARAANVRELIGHYVKTDRNELVRDHYAKLGFECVARGEEHSQWRLDVSLYVDVSVPIELIFPGTAERSHIVS